MNRTVYRIEDERGTGAFNALPSGAFKRFEDLNHFDPDRFPTPWTDDALQEDPHFEELTGNPDTRFGCCDRETLAEWFPPATASILSENGLTLTVWEVPPNEVAASPRQAIFDHRKARLVERLPVAALYA